MKWLLYGILASILFGLWGLFDKLSSNLDPFLSNLVLYSAAFLIAAIMLLKNRKLPFSKYSILSGIFAGIGNFFVLYALLNNLLILVLPFVSLSGAVFFLIIYLTENPKYSSKQKFVAGIGLLLSIIGLILISTSSFGISNFIQAVSLNKNYFLSAIFILIGFSLWTYFTYKSVAREKINAITYNFWTNLSSLVISLLAVILLKPNTFYILQSFSLKEYIYPILAGISVAAGTFFTYKAFKTTTTKTKLQEVMVGILANGELIPLLFLSYFVLGEYVPQGFIGVIIALVGLFAIHYAEVSK